MGYFSPPYLRRGEGGGPARADLAGAGAVPGAREVPLHRRLQLPPPADGGDARLRHRLPLREPAGAPPALLQPQAALGVAGRSFLARVLLPSRVFWGFTAILTLKLDLGKVHSESP